MNTTILFDADGVIINAKMFSQHLEDDFGITRETTKPFFTTVFNKCLEGQADLKTEIKPYLKKWGWTKSLESFTQYWFQAEHVIDQKLIRLIQQLRTNGVKCFVATNQEHHRANYMRNEMNFDQHFDGVFSSADLGSKKPKIEFFEKVYQKINSPKKEATWFFDDTKGNVESAIEFGINGRKYTNFDNFYDLAVQQNWV